MPKRRSCNTSRMVSLRNYQPKRSSANAPIKQANGQAALSSDEHIGKTGTAAARDHYGTIGEFKTSPTIDRFARPLIQVDDTRPMYVVCAKDYRNTHNLMKAT